MYQYTADELRDAYEKGQSVVHLEGNVPAAHVTIRSASDGVSELGAVHTLKDYQGKGYAKKVIQAALQKSQGKVVFALSTPPMEMRSDNNIFETCGMTNLTNGMSQEAAEQFIRIWCEEQGIMNYMGTRTLGAGRQLFVKDMRIAKDGKEE